MQEYRFARVIMSAIFVLCLLLIVFPIDFVNFIAFQMQYVSYVMLSILMAVFVDMFLVHNKRRGFFGK